MMHRAQFSFSPSPSVHIHVPVMHVTKLASSPEFVSFLIWQVLMSHGLRPPGYGLRAYMDCDHMLLWSCLMHMHIIIIVSHISIITIIIMCTVSYYYCFCCASLCLSCLLSPTSRHCFSQPNWYLLIGQCWVSVN